MHTMAGRREIKLNDPNKPATDIFKSMRAKI
jgi:hypothetical protein